jgi:fumarylacetoacetate (FAA) hydrolase
VEAVKVARYRHGRTLCVGVVVDDECHTVHTGSSANQQSLLRLARAATYQHVDAVPVDEVRFLSPVPTPPAVRDFYAFEAHVATARRTRGLEMDPEWYEVPVFYFSNPGSIVGPGDEVHAPHGCEELDYELEVAAVIGTECRDVPPDRWLDVVAGFTIMNDWSARDLQRREMRLGLGPAKGKDFATSLGPVLVTPDELVDGFDVPRGAMAARVNGEEWSRGDLGDLHHGWGVLVAHASRDATLRAGDVIGSGTVGTGCILELSAVHGSDRYPWLRPGDVVELDVEGIGALVNRVSPRRPTSPTR